MGVLEVAGNERFESFLASSVPQLKTYHFALDCDVLGYEVDADGWLAKIMHTFLVGSN